MAIYPGQIFVEANNIPCPVVTAYTAVTGANTLVGAAVTGKRLRCVAATFASNSAQSTIAIKSGSGGTVLTVLNIPAATSASPNVILEYNPAGWFESGDGSGLYADKGADNVHCSLQYIAYTKP